MVAFARPKPTYSHLLLRGSFRHGALVKSLVHFRHLLVFVLGLRFVLGIPGVMLCTSLRSNFHVVLIWNVGGHFDRPVEKYDGLIWSSNPNEHLGKSSQLHLLSHGIFSFESGFLDFWTI
jgi:hypothetical protein